MTINEENKISTRIGHPRLFGGRFVALNIINFSRQVENDITYIPKPKNPDPASFFQGPDILATDMMKIEDTFQPSARIRTRGNGGKAAFAQYMFIEETGEQYDSAEVSHANGDEEELVISKVGFDTYFHIGATKLKQGSTVLKNATAGTTLAEGTDYEVDHHEGKIKIFSSAGAKTDYYTLGYVFKLTARNIANSLAKIPKFGGAAIFAFGIDDGYTGEAKGFNYTVFLNSVDLSLEPQQPNEAEVELDMRVAKLVNTT